MATNSLADGSAARWSAEHRRDAQPLKAALADPNPLVRREAARGLSRVNGDGLDVLLFDEDAEVASWSAYGLGFFCAGKEDATSKLLVSRGIALRAKVKWSDAESGLLRSIARALGRCGTSIGEGILGAWLHAGAPLDSAAVQGLGVLAGKKRELSGATMEALASSTAPAHWFPMSRVRNIPERFAPALLNALAHEPANDDRVFLIRALGKLGPQGLDALVRVAMDASFSVAERSEAARAVASDPSRVSAVLIGLALEAKAFEPFVREGRYNVLYTLLQAAKPAPSFPHFDSLLSIATLTTPPDASQLLVKRATFLRCAAARLVAGGNPAYPLLAKCEGSTKEPDAIDAARLSVVLEKPLTGGRQRLWEELSGSPSLTVREHVVDAIGDHPELGFLGTKVLIDALLKEPGMVATAAEVIVKHPDLVMIVSSLERKRALDPAAPPPEVFSAPQKELDPDVKRAVLAAAGKPWPADALETRAQLLDVIAAFHLMEGKALATGACTDPNATVREHAKKALVALGDLRDCSRGSPPAIKEALGTPFQVELDTDAGTLSLRFDEKTAPLHLARLKELFQNGFYKGSKAHRVVSGFVVQFGDPNGDGYGGSGEWLPCETSEAPFSRYAIGMALAGRDTGSSQLFVTLSPVPHLEGDYTRVGKADGPWDAIAPFDVIRETRVTEIR